MFALSFEWHHHIASYVHIWFQLNAQNHMLDTHMENESDINEISVNMYVR